MALRLSVFLSIMFVLLSSSAQKQSSMALVGNGMTGAWLARLLRDSGYAGALTIYEKSTVYGGRCATKAFASGARFDHGAQYYALKNVMAPLHKYMTKSALVNTWFTEKGVDRVKSPQGISTLAKETTTNGDVDVKLQHQVAKLERIPATATSVAAWRIHFTDGRAEAEVAVVVLTCPLPQALDILAASGIQYESSLGDIAYAKALVLLYSPKDDTQDAAFRMRLQQSTRLANNNGFYTVTDQQNDATASARDGEAGDAHSTAAAAGVYAIADQRAKGVSTVPAYTIIMNPAFSEAHYNDAEDADVVARIRAEMDTLFEDGGSGSKSKNAAAAAERFSFAADGAGDLLFLKRWKYSHPLTTHSEPFVEVEVDDDDAEPSARALKAGRSTDDKEDKKEKKDKKTSKTAGFASGLFLAGDAFGGASVPGAIASATALAAHIVEAQQL